MTTRRGFLRNAALTAGATAAASALPLSVQKALAAEVAPGSLDGIKHVVFLMQENRSFDHYFGALSGTRGFADRNVIARRNGKTVFEQPGYVRDVYPFLVRDAVGFGLRPGAQKQFALGLPHGWSDGHDALKDGWNDNWIWAKTPGTMMHHDRADLPFYYELADAFTICDAYHCSVLSSTNPNRLYHYSGNVGFEPDGRRTTDNASSGDDHPGYTYKTLAETLQANGRTWKVYQEWDNYDDNGVHYFKTFKDIGRKILAGKYPSLNAFYNAVLAAKDPAPLLAELQAGLANLTPAERDLYDRGLKRVNPGQLTASFRADVAGGTLPEVSYIAAPTALSEHPGSSAPGRGFPITYDVLDAIASDPETWKSTAVFITYDENDGLYDHVPPPLPPAGTPGEFVDGRPIGLGFRVPMLVVSPWTVGGNVCSEVFDHTSTVQFVEKWLNLSHPEIGAWRRTVAGDLTSAFDFAHPRKAETYAHPAPDPGNQLLLPALPPLIQKPPKQEPGTRPARPLPYRTEAHARLTGTDLTITLDDTGARKSHYALYPYAGEFATPQHYDGASTVTVKLKSSYNLTLTGPNGFRREFTGTTAGKAAQAAVSSTQDRRTLVLRLENPTAAPLTFKIEARAYTTGTTTITLAPAQAKTVRHSTAEGWYDLKITTSDDPSFTRRLMGHLETGAPSITG